MSIKIGTYPTSLRPSSTVAVNTAADICVTKNNDIEVAVKKNEYTIIGDRLYTSYTNYPPPWLQALIDALMNQTINDAVSGLDDLRDGLLDALDDIEVAENTYTTSIISFKDDLMSVNAVVNTLNSTFNDNSATIIETLSTMATKDMAAAIAADRIEASLNEGSIKSRIDILNSAISTVDKALADSVIILTANYNGIADAQSILENTVEANSDKAMANLAYNATLKLTHNGVPYYYSSGFGLKTILEGGNNANAPKGTSEFWINADIFRLTSNSANGDRYTPFIIDGPEGLIKMTGDVSIDGNITEVKNIHAVNVLADNVTVNWRLQSERKGLTDEPILELDMMDGVIIIRDNEGNTRVQIGLL